MLITVIKYVGLIIGSYLLGGVMFAKILSKLNKDDITSHDSGNPGTINMLRNHGILFGLLTFVLDALKGVTAALVGYFLFGGVDGGLIARTAIYIGGVSAVVGHIFPVFFKFKGGKGVATASGIAFVAHPLVGTILFVVYILMLVVIKIGSLSSLLIAIAYLITDTVMLIIEQNYIALGLLYFVVALIVWAHRGNIKRLAQKNEKVIDLKAVAQKDIDRINALKHKKDKVENNTHEQTAAEVETSNLETNE